MSLDDVDYQMLKDALNRIAHSLESIDGSLARIADKCETGVPVSAQVWEGES